MDALTIGLVLVLLTISFAVSLAEVRRDYRLLGDKPLPPPAEIQRAMDQTCFDLHGLAAAAEAHEDEDEIALHTGRS